MKTILGTVLSAALVAALSAIALDASAQAQSKPADKKAPADIAGRWSMMVHAHGGAAMALDLKQDGTKVTGTFETPHDNFKVEGELNGDALTLSTPPTTEARIVLKATLKENGTLDGYLSSQMGDMTWTAERAKGK